MLTRYSDKDREEISEEMDTSDVMYLNDPGHILDISLRKQQQERQGQAEDLYRTVLVSNTIRETQKEIRKNIMASLFF